MGGRQTSAEIKTEKEEEEKLITFTISLFLVYMPECADNHSIGYMVEYNLTCI